MGGRTGTAEALAHTPWEDQEYLFLDHTVKNGGANPMKRPDLNRLRGTVMGSSDVAFASGSCIGLSGKKESLGLPVVPNGLDGERPAGTGASESDDFVSPYLRRRLRPLAEVLTGDRGPKLRAVHVKAKKTPSHEVDRLAAVATSLSKNGRMVSRPPTDLDLDPAARTAARS